VPREQSLTWTFDPDALSDLAVARSEAYRTSAPFPHTVIDDFLPSEVLDDVLAEFPESEDGSWSSFQTEQEKKLASNRYSTFPPVLRHVLSEFNSSSCVEFLEQLTGISGLIPDPHFLGGGLHRIEPGGFLKIHADFNRQDRLSLDRRLNLLLFLNRDWREEYGGHLELWDQDMSRCRERILPVFNRCVVFSITDTAFHGHPEPLRCPAGMSRRSLALYYYTNGRPVSEVARRHTTAFQRRPGDEGLKGRLDVKALAEDLLPPAVTRRVKRLKGKQ
jgi:hypothetical protein